MQGGRGSGIPGFFGKQWNNNFAGDVLNLPNQVGGSFANGFKDNGKTAGIGFNFAKGYQDRAWVDQPSVFSGTGKVTINVGGNTHLKGASVFSKSGDLTLNSGTLTYDDIRNYDRSKNIGFSINLSHSFGGPGGQTDTQKTKDAIARIGDVFNASGFGVDGSYEETDKQGITHATIGAGEISIRDKEKQAELESSGKTQKVANINRDLDKAQEVTKDERKALGVYVTDTSIKEVVKGVEITADTIHKIGEAITDALVAKEELTPKQKSEIDAALKHVSEQAKKGDKKQAIEELKEIAANPSCRGGKQSFNLFEWLIPSAHAAGACVLSSGASITAEGAATALDVLFEVASQSSKRAVAAVGVATLALASVFLVAMTKSVNGEIDHKETLPDGRVIHITGFGADINQNVTITNPDGSVLSLTGSLDANNNFVVQSGFTDIGDVRISLKDQDLSSLTSGTSFDNTSGFGNIVFNESSKGKGEKEAGKKADEERKRPIVTDDSGKVRGPLPDVDEIDEDDLDRVDGELGTSIGTRSRENERFPKGNPNGSEKEKIEFDKYKKHQERIDEEQRLREKVRQRLKKMDG